MSKFGKSFIRGASDRITAPTPFTITGVVLNDDQLRDLLNGIQEAVEGAGLEQLRIVVGNYVFTDRSDE